MGISHGEDAASVASATMPELTARLLTVPSRSYCRNDACYAAEDEMYAGKYFYRQTIDGVTDNAECQRNRNPIIKPAQHLFRN